MTFRKRGDQYDDVEEENYQQKAEENLPANPITLEEYKHKALSEAKDPKVHEPPVLGSHSESLGFKTDHIENPVEKKEVNI